MTLTFMRPAIALALALSLASCGGKATFPVSGTIFGLQYGGLVLSSNGMDLPVDAKASSFTFPNALSYGEVYNVVQKTKPAHQNCTIGSLAGYNGATDTAGRFGKINIGVTCSTNVAVLGGKISGLASAGLQLTNGSDTVSPLATNTAFTLQSVAYGTTYGIAVLTQPANQVCSVSNGTGVMGDLAPDNIVVSCVNNT